MENGESRPRAVAAPSARERDALMTEWRRLSRAPTFVAVLTSPALFSVLYGVNDWPLIWSLVVTVLAVMAFRGFVDIVVNHFIPRPSLYGADRETLQDDAMMRRRLWFWRGKYKLALWIFGLLFGALLLLSLILGESIGGTVGTLGDYAVALAPTLLILGLQLPLLFLINFLILFGPLLFFGLKQMKGYEPGDADWGVRLDDVRGQKEAKEEVRRVIALWQSGEAFEKAGGKRERGLLFLGAPGTGKTMLSKAIATGFNCPFVTMPGSGFAQTFIGLDVVIVMFLVRKAKKLAAKWGGQCIVFIDEIDAVGMRRNALGSASMTDNPYSPDWLSNHLFFGRYGARNPTGDMILETRAWREQLFASRHESSAKPLPQPYAKLDSIMRQAFPGGGMFGGYGMALNQLLVQMDGIDEPPFFRKFFTNRLNT